MRIVYEDDDLLAVDKPAGVPSQSADPSHPDDLLHRLRRSEGLDYLGVHQRLDQDTSGVILFAKQPRANPGLARQFEARSVDKRYLALVTGYRGGDRTVAHDLTRDRDGRTVVAKKGDRRKKRAVSHLRVLSQRGDRALLEVKIETGRTHQIRAQLAELGAPVLGDRLYGGAPAPRLMLHARSLGLEHPVSGEPLGLSAAPPPIFEALLEDRFEADAAFPMLLEAALERRWGLSHRDGLTAYRVFSAGDGIEGLEIDRYGDFLVAHVYEPSLEALLEERVLDQLGARGLYVKRRPRQANELVDPRTADVSPAAPLLGEPAPDPLVILENGLPYVTRLADGLSTGLFLDQRENRLRVQELARGKRVLNLFSYTCGFALAAAAGGAEETVSVDASKRLLAWGRENLENAGQMSERHRFVHRDVFDVLRAMQKKGRRFDLVILDPPTYSKTKSTRWKSGAEWVKLAGLALAVLEPGGVMLACSNDRRMRLGAFRKHLRAAADEREIELAQLKDLPCPRDFSPAFGEPPHLKSLLLTRGQ